MILTPAACASLSLPALSLSIPLLKVLSGSWSKGEGRREAILGDIQTKRLCRLPLKLCANYKKRGCKQKTVLPLILVLDPFAGVVHSVRRKSRGGGWSGPS